jgi:uncharacterized Fe-S center protein
MGTYYIIDGCINCAACADAYPAEAITEQGDVHVIDKDACIDCEACDDVCPVEVIKRETPPRWVIASPGSCAVAHRGLRFVHDQDCKLNHRPIFHR